MTLISITIFINVSHGRNNMISLVPLLTWLLCPPALLLTSEPPDSHSLSQLFHICNLGRYETHSVIQSWTLKWFQNANDLPVHVCKQWEIKLEHFKSPKLIKHSALCIVPHSLLLQLLLPGWHLNTREGKQKDVTFRHVSNVWWHMHWMARKIVGKGAYYLVEMASVYY